MWFLIKGSFWCTAMLVALSYLSPRAADDMRQPLDVTAAISAASEAYHYVSGLCREKPDVCEKGSETFSALGIKARDGALVAFELLDQQFGPQQKSDIALKSDPRPAPFPQQQALEEDTASIFTGSVPVPLKRPGR